MPQDFLRLCMERRVKVQVFENRELVGVLHAYDEHCNIILNEVTETLTVPGQDGIPMKHTRNLDLLFIRGDRVITISPL